MPPVLPAIRSDLHLSFALAGAVSALPVLCLGAAALPGAVLANRFGARRLLLAASVGLGLGALVRLLPPQPAGLIAGTLLLSICVAAAQPGAAQLVRAWFPSAVQRAATIYSNGLTVGGLAGATLTAPLALLAGWRGTFVTWALPALATAALWFWLAPGREGHESQPSGLLRLARNPEVWRAAGLFGAQSVCYFTAATWVPFLLQSSGPGYVALVLFSMNVLAVPLTVLLAAVRRPYATSPAFYVAAGLLTATGTAGLMLGLAPLAWLFGASIGLGTSLTFAGAMALPPVLAGTETEVAGYSAFMYGAGYLVSFIGPLLGGLLVDATDSFVAPFWAVLVGALAMLALGATMSRRGRAA